MRRKVKMRISALALLSGCVLRAQDITGDWQGTLKTGAGELRLIVQIAKGNDGGWKATMINIDQTQDRGAALPVSSVTLKDSVLKLSMAAIRARYEGNVSADGASIDGTMTQNAVRPLKFQRATPETAWKDPSPHTVQFVTVGMGVQL